MSEVLFGSYPAIRRRAEEMNTRLPANHPCRRGNGECCRQKNIAITVEDIEIIEEALDSGEIPDLIIKQAIENASDPNREYCPFFDTGEKVCTIYKYRPVNCIKYGMGGQPKSIRTIADTIAGLTKASEEPDVPLSDMEHIYMCAGCFNSSDEPRKAVPLQDVLDTWVIDGYLSQPQLPVIRIVDFARFVLPKV